MTHTRLNLEFYRMESQTIQFRTTPHDFILQITYDTKYVIKILKLDYVFFMRCTRKKYTKIIRPAKNMAVNCSSLFPYKLGACRRLPFAYWPILHSRCAAVLC